ncbi:MAG: tRNA (adenosine(37)-N6)-threonylcarbamoyltransferase complex transferase subunit TsaD [Alphaproteobacteria bacterium]|nr:tRNA (adenosine(37)-N6)-threonylcarbamoyltransferase complex transferase subunit TsaD [Alphaproteobacteria bacterium]
MNILGIETSCDETAVALVNDQRQILGHKVLSQYLEHLPYGGVVPEIAARAHMDHLDQLIKAVMAEANLDFDQIDAIAVTAGPGLIGGVMVGVMMAKGLAYALKKPLIGVNHLEGHALTVRLVEPVAFPYLLLLVSGGHCQILVVKGVGHYRLLGTTIDDALGEAFDKVAKMLGLGYPGGPLVESLAAKGNGHAFALPRPLIQQPGCDFSFSGLKTAVKRLVDAQPSLNEAIRADICASFQMVVGDIITNRILNAMNQVKTEEIVLNRLVIAGGVAANRYLRSRLCDVAATQGYEVVAPPLALCTDNAAMIAWAGVERFKRGLTDSLELIPRARWPLAENNE